LQYSITIITDRLVYLTAALPDVAHEESSSVTRTDAGSHFPFEQRFASLKAIFIEKSDPFHCNQLQIQVFLNTLTKHFEEKHFLEVQSGPQHVISWKNGEFAGLA